MTLPLMSVALALLAAAPVLAAPGPAGLPPFTQAIIIGSNRSVDQQLQPLRYADDDAARFAELFTQLGIKVHLLTRADASTSRLHPEVLAGARAPSAGALRATVVAAAAEVAHARGQGRLTTLFVIFAGHGNVEHDRAYITLEDARLYPADILEGIVREVAAAKAHVIIDACHSYLFALSRGPGGTQQAARGFLQGALGPGNEDVGFLLSSSPSGESHEWEALQSGVFSHEVRSGLAGAADVNGDGRVAYRELAAFVSRANAAIVNEFYRPRVFARSPRDTDVLLDLTAAQVSRLQVDGAASGKHLVVEDARGVRWADFHSGQGQSLRLALPGGNRPLFVRDAGGGQEATLEDPAPEVVLADQPFLAPRTESRGAAHHAFKSLFTLPFDRSVVAAFDPDQEWKALAVAPGGEPPLRLTESVLPPRRVWAPYLAYGSASAAVLSTAAGVTLGMLAEGPPAGATRDVAQVDLERRRSYGRVATGLLVGGAALAVVSTAVFWRYWSDIVGH